MPAAPPFILTPGPVVTASEVKEAMLADYAPADDFIRTSTQTIREYLLRLANGLRLASGASYRERVREAMGLG